MLEWAAKSRAALPLLIGIAGVGAYSLRRSARDDVLRHSPLRVRPLPRPLA